MIPTLGVFSTSVQLTLHPGAPSPYETRRSESGSPGPDGAVQCRRIEVGTQFYSSYPVPAWAFRNISSDFTVFRKRPFIELFYK